MVDLYTFLSPPAPYHQLFVLTPPGAAPAEVPAHHQVHEGAVSISRIGDIAKGVTDAIDKYSPDQGGPTGPGFPGHDASQLSMGAGGRCETGERDNSWR